MHYLGKDVSDIYIDASPNYVDPVLTLKYRNGSYELIAVTDPDNIKQLLFDRNLALQPKRGGRASLLHI